MNDPLDTYKQAASLLLKDLRSHDRERSHAAASRFVRLSALNADTPEEILLRRDTIQRKHALDIIARENRFLSWTKLKHAQDTDWVSRRGDLFLNIWCKSHAEAREIQAARGGYILTDRGKCFVVESGYIRTLGLDPDDERWEKIGFDCCHPANEQAYEELLALVRASAKDGDFLAETETGIC